MVQVGLYAVALSVSITSFALSIASIVQTNWIYTKTPASSPITLSSSYGLFYRCDSTSWTGDSVTCRKFPARDADCASIFDWNTDSMSSESLAQTEADDSPRTQIEKRSPDWTDWTMGGLAKTKIGLAGAPSKGAHILSRTTNEKYGSSERVVASEARKRLGKHEQQDSWTLCDSWLTAGYAAQLSLVFGSTSLFSILIVLLGGRAKRENGWRIIAGLLSIHAACLIIATSLVVHEYNSDDRFFYGARLGKGFIMATVAWCLDVITVGALVIAGIFKLVQEDDYEPIEDEDED